MNINDLLAIAEPGVPPEVPELVPGLQASGEPVWREDDTNPQHFHALGLAITRGGKKLYSDPKLPSIVSLTDSRLVLASSQFDRGSDGMPAGPEDLIFKAIGRARAKSRSRGLYLVLQIWWPWLITIQHVIYSNWVHDSHLIQLTVTSDLTDRVHVRVMLPRETDPHPLAQSIADRAWASRLQDQKLNDDAQARLRDWSPHVRRAEPRKLSGVNIPGARRVGSKTTHPMNEEASA